jgi:hypothetical protein
VARRWRLMPARCGRRNGWFAQFLPARFHFEPGSEKGRIAVRSLMRQQLAQGHAVTAVLCSSQAAGHGSAGDGGSDSNSSGGAGGAGRLISRIRWRRRARVALAPCRIALRIIWHGARLLNALPTSKMRMARMALRLAMSPSLEEHGGELSTAFGRRGCRSGSFSARTC